jgi:hypothetical protein
MPRTKISVFPPTASSTDGGVTWTQQPLQTIDSALRRLALAIALPFTPLAPAGTGMQIRG